jgi:hypothetical protein
MTTNITLNKTFEVELDDEDPEQKELEVIEFYKQGGHKQEVGDLLTADDYPECAE